ncbi:hypothetical protein M3231_19115 [Neobacillus mesonae]|nr:hypothetical protein [Neobacillus mesonae]
MKKWQAVRVCISVIALVTAGMLIHQVRSFSIAEDDLEKHMTDQVSGWITETKIELTSDVGNYKLYFFSVEEGKEADVNPKIGVAFYEKGWLGNNYRYDGIGVSTNTFDSYLFEAVTGYNKGNFLVVYGRNPSETKVFERFRVQFHEETFANNLPKKEYFMEVFPVTHYSEESFNSSISFETEDLNVESYPLFITSKMK